MRILAGTTHWGGHQEAYLRKMLDYWDRLPGHVVDFVIFGESVDYKPTAMNLKTVRLNGQWGGMLCMAHRLFYYDRRTEYDIYAYLDNDIIPGHGAVEAYLEHSTVLSGSRFVPGFLRYEQRADDRFLLDLHPMHSVHRGGDGTTHAIKAVHQCGARTYYEPWNPHAAIYLLDQERLGHLIHDGHYTGVPRYVTPVEASCTDIYVGTRYTKVVPRDGMTELLVHHSPDTYTTRTPRDFDKARCPTTETLADWALRNTGAR